MYVFVDCGVVVHLLAKQTKQGPKNKSGQCRSCNICSLTKMRKLLVTSLFLWTSLLLLSEVSFVIVYNFTIWVDWAGQ